MNVNKEIYAAGDIDFFLKPLDPKGDQHLISPYNNTAESFMKIMRIKEMITNLGRNMENMDTDVRVSRSNH